MKRALITGITGQDGSYLAEFLLDKGYTVHGIIRRNSTSDPTDRIKQLLDNPNIHLHYGDLSDFSNVTSLIQETKPDEIYNLAAQSHVKVSFSNSLYTTDINAVGVTRLLEAVRVLGLENKTRFYQASTSEMFGKVQETPQTEDTPFYPRSPYGVAKLYAYWIVRNYRESYNLFASNGILFNHESPRRGELFVTRKITKTLAEIRVGIKKGPLELGNLDAKRDWGHAKDYVRGMWMMLQNETPGDYVLSMEEQHSVRDFINIACNNFGFDIEWSGNDINEIGVDKNTGKIIIQINPDYYRPSEVETLIGDCTKVKTQLGWKPEYTFKNLVEEMCEYDLKKAMEKKNEYVY
jgi:GDPmannose 4,6-dehydratase